MAELTVARVTVPRLRKVFGGRVIVWLSVGWLAVVVLAAVFADLLPLQPYDLPVAGMRPRTPPGFAFPEPFGTDVVGRSMLSRLVYGARQSLLIGLIAVAGAMVAGLVIGMAAGYLRGRTDALLGVVLDSSLAIPPLVLLLAIAAVGQRTVWTVALSLAIVGVPSFARLARAGTLALADRDYVLAARAMGATHLRVIRRELLPPVFRSVSTYAILFLGTMIVAEGSLAFLGLGVPPPSPSWGRMVNDGRPFLGTQPSLVFVPAACLVLTVVACSAIGDRIHRKAVPR